MCLFLAHVEEKLKFKSLKVSNREKYLNDTLVNTQTLVAVASCDRGGEPKFSKKNLPVNLTVPAARGGNRVFASENHREIEEKRRTGLEVKPGSELLEGSSVRKSTSFVTLSDDFGIRLL